MPDAAKPTAEPAAAAPAGEQDEALVARLETAYRQVGDEVHKLIVGMDDVLEQALIGIFARGHCLLEGVPGLAKTLLIDSLARALSLSFKRIQFTPDLMPSDITGTEILQDDPATGQRRFVFIKGPVFANIILADEINRTPPKTQAALLEAMQEQKISISGDDYALEQPFFVLATQNPLEQEGTYPLPEAQLDRFFFKIYVNYPSYDEEIAIMKSITGATRATLAPVLAREEILALQQLVRRVPVADHVFHYAANLVRLTRPHEAKAPDFVKNWLAYGAGPRASLNLILAAKARATLRGRFHAAIEDIQAVAPPVLRHRLGTNFAAQSTGVRTDEIVRRLLDAVPADEKLYHA